MGKIIASFGVCHILNVVQYLYLANGQEFLKNPKEDNSAIVLLLIEQQCRSNL